jgi:integrase
MPRTLNRLNARKLATLDKVGRHADGGGLYLSISANGGRRWVFMYTWRGKQTELGLGSARTVPLARARILAAECRDILADGRDPKETRKPSEAKTFGAIADEVGENMQSSWRNGRTKEDWKRTMGNHAHGIREIPIADITTDDVLAVLKPIWNTTYVTASRLRGKIERVLDAAKARGLRKGENPARWKGHLDQLLPKRQKVEIDHHAAMPYAALPAFVARLRERGGMRDLAMEFVILTAARAGEVLGAPIEEFDLEAALWTVPAIRMKGGREHRVPLSRRAVEIVREALRLGKGCGPYAFPGQKPGRPLAASSFQELLIVMGVEGATPHGFRSTFKDWAAEATEHQDWVSEKALAHLVGDETRRAYQRGELLDKRRRLMADWADFCAAGDGRGLDAVFHSRLD